ncbi:MAG: cache domain-containing protein, partial [Planctomycetota bacterium]
MKRPPLHWRIVTILLIVSLMPISLMGIGAWVVFGRLFEERAFELQFSVVEKHAQAIESYLDERVHLLELLAGTHTLDEISDPAVLRERFAGLNRVSKDGFVDLGVIDSDGVHRAYVGPFDLKDRNYKEASWFEEVMAGGVHISDVFLGFREVPHCIIAVKTRSRSESWILRATINSDQFDHIVRTGVLGKSGDAFILNRKGCYQNTPKVGSVLDKAPLAAIEPHRGVREYRLEMEGHPKIQVTTWLNSLRWVLVVQQDAAEVRAPVRSAMASGGILMLFCIVLVVVTTFLATRHLSRRIDRANAEREEMFRAFMRSAKLASVGELATGLAHEINNPLAIISAEETNIDDIAQEMDGAVEGRKELLDSANRIKQQVMRCGGITAKMLQFGHKGDTALEPTEIAPRLSEIVGLLQRQAGVRNVEMSLEVEEDLPRVLADPLELEQVLVNLINNSFHALPEGGTIRIIARHVDQEVQIEVRDSGNGIPPEILDRIFEPFFTTKPVGQGTGL